MTAGRWQQISQLYHAALARDMSARAAYLDQACAGDDALRREVESLLECEPPDPFLETTMPGPAAQVMRETVAAMPRPGATFGRYQIVRELGRGGMGVVFLGEDPTLRRKLAIKVLPSSKEDQAARARLLGEARSASALNHPNICTVYEVGTESGCMFIAMEYVEGRPLSELVEVGPLPLQDVVRFGVSTADALAHAHGRGVIHCDLKAANAIVASAGWLKIVDFGLARQLDLSTSEALTATTGLTRMPGLIAGTPYAMAPEQLRGASSADVRTDIWAFGVLLYEMMAGAKPFRGATLVELCSAILRDPPAPVPPATPALLREVMQKCLAKDPNRRYQRAADARLALETLASGLGRADSRPTVHIAAAESWPLPPALATSADAVPFVGRESELAAIGSVWTRAQGGPCPLLLVAGEPGIGKTRLCVEFTRTEAAQGALVLVGRSDREALVPYQPFVEALSWYVRVCPEAELRGHLSAIGGGAELTHLIPELLRRVPDLPVPPAMNPEAQRYRLFEAVGALLAEVSATHPLLLMLDDLHWGDKPTLLMLRHILRTSTRGRLCIIGTYREGELGRTHPLAEVLAELRRNLAVTQLSLGGLDEAQVRRLVATLAGADLRPQALQYVVQSTEGNPFFVAEMWRQLMETDAIDRAVTGRPLPEGIRHVIGGRVSRLGEDCHRLLSLAAVIGREFDLEVLETLGDLPEHRLLDALDDAMRAQLISEVPGTPDRFSFMHALIRETLYSDLSTSRRLRLHRSVGEAIERFALRRSTAPLAELAYHFTQAAAAGLADKAIDYAVRAGDRAADGLAHEEAARFYEMGLQSLNFKAAGPEADATRADLHARRAQAFVALAQWRLAKPDLEFVLQHLDPQQAERRAEILLQLAMTSHWLFDIPAVERVSAEALALAETVERADLAADAITWLGRCQVARGDLRGGLDMDRRAIERAGRAKTHTLAEASITFYLAGHPSEAIPLAFDAAAFAHSSRNIGHLMYVLPHIGLSLGGVGRYAEAASVFKETRQLGRKYGVLPFLARATAMAAGFHLSVFDFEGAEALQSEARELARSVGFAPPVVSAGIDLLLTFARRRDPGAAEILLQETTAAAASTPGWHEWLWRLRLSQVRAELALARGEHAIAAAAAQESVDQSRARGRPKYEALGLITKARALRHLGRTREAIADAAQAVAVARRTSDPALILVALDTLLGLEGDDEHSAEALALSDRILDALPDETMRRRFTESEVVRRVHGRR